MANCYHCKHLRKETESWELPQFWYWECRAIPGRANLTSFPFRRTNCPSFVVKAGGARVAEYRLEGA